MKTLEMWYAWLLREQEKLVASDADVTTQAEVRASLRLLLRTMRDNKPRKSKNVSFKMFVYNHLLEEVERAHYRIPPAPDERLTYADL